MQSPTKIKVVPFGIKLETVQRLHTHSTIYHSSFYLHPEIVTKMHITKILYDVKKEGYYEIRARQCTLDGSEDQDPLHIRRPIFKRVAVYLTGS